MGDGLWNLDFLFSLLHNFKLKQWIFSAYLLLQTISNIQTFMIRTPKEFIVDSRELFKTLRIEDNAAGKEELLE